VAVVAAQAVYPLPVMKHLSAEQLRALVAKVGLVGPEESVLARALAVLAKMDRLEPLDLADVEAVEVVAVVSGAWAAQRPAVWAAVAGTAVKARTDSCS
jgi:hypothetical protein